MENLRTKFINYSPGGPEKMFIDQRNLKSGEGELILKVRALGINRAQCLHRQGKYKVNRPQEGFLGLEAAGQVYDPHTNKKLYDGMALITGGSYAEYVSVPSSHILPLPKQFTYLQGGAIPEAWLTAFQLLRLGSAKQGDNVVIYAGASGVGTAVIQLGKILKLHVWCVVSSPDKGKVCQELGAAGVVYYRDNPTWAKDLVLKKGGQFDIVLDCVGASNVESTIDLLAVDGKWVLFGLLSGAMTNINLGNLLFKRINLISTTLKTRSDEYKTNLIEDFKETVLPGFQKGILKPLIFTTFEFDWSSVAPFVEAHTLMESNTNVGKIMIRFKQ